MNSKIEIDLSSARFPVFVGAGLLNEISSKYREFGGRGKAYLIVDELIFDKYRYFIKNIISSLDADVFCLTAGKSNKTFATAMSIFADLDRNKISRDSTILAIGGGVVGDLAGFVASCWYRGVNLIHVPTTLLSAVDSCVGGKTAINFRDTVNAVGSYWHPSSIIIDTRILHDLPSREVSSGFAEIIKYATLGESNLLRLLESKVPVTEETLSEFVMLSLKQKEKFVRGDVHEASNRLFLNFGHTIGHAIEFSTVFNGSEMLRHGEGVSLGMVAVFRICVELGFLRESDLKRLKNILESRSLPIFFDASSLDMNPDNLRKKVINLVFKDKKRTHDSLRFIMLNGWGKPFIYSTSDFDLIALGVEEVIT